MERVLFLMTVLCPHAPSDFGRPAAVEPIKPLQTIPPQGHRVESRGRLGGAHTA